VRSGDSASAEGNCRGEGSSKVSGFRRIFILVGAAAKQVESNEIAFGVHSRIAEGGSEGAAGN